METISVITLFNHFIALKLQTLAEKRIPLVSKFTMRTSLRENLSRISLNDPPSSAIKLFIWLGTGGNYSLGHFVFTNSFKFVVAPSTLPTFLHKLLPGAPFCCLRGPPVLSVLYSSFSHFSQPYFSRISIVV